MSEDKMFGREYELNLLKNIVNTVAKGKSKIVFITGKAGVGKTFLARFVGKYAEEEGFIYVEGKCKRKSMPYHPFIEIFKKLGKVKDDANTILNLLSEDGEEGKVYPKDRESFQAMRHYRWWKIAEWLENLSIEMPICIFIDDLQFADAATLQLIYFLIGHLEVARILLIGAYSTEEIMQNKHLENLITRLMREGNFTEINLQSLKEKDIKEMLQHILKKEEVPKNFLRNLMEITDGNPLIVKEIINQMIIDGILKPDEDIYPENLENINISNTVEDIVRKKLEGLSDKERYILNLGSVIGNEIPYSLLLKSSQFDENSLLECIEKLVSKGFWSEGDEGEKLIFSEKITRKIIYESIDSNSKKKMHRNVGDAILKLHSEEINRYLSEIGYHYELAGEIDKAVEYYISAGKIAEKIYAHEDAINMYLKVLNLAEDVQTKLTILDKIGDVYRIIGNYTLSEKYYLEGLNIAEKNEDKIKFYAKIGNIYCTLGNYDNAIEIMKKGLRLKCENSRKLCTLLNELGWAYLRKGEFAEARSVFMKELRIAEELNDKEFIAHAYHNLGSLSIPQAMYKEGVDYLLKAISIFEEMEDFGNLAPSYNNLAVVYYEAGNILKALYYYVKCLEISEKIGYKHIMRGVLINLANIYTMMGELKKAMEYSNRSLKISREIGNRYGIGVAYSTIGYVYSKMGKYDCAIKYFKDALNILKDMNNKYVLGATYTDVANAYRLKGDIESSILYYEKAKRVCEEINDLYDLANIMKGLAEIEISKGNINCAIKYIEESLKIADNIASQKLRASSMLTYSKIFRKAKKLNEAINYLQESIEIFEKINNIVELPEAYYEMAYTLSLLGKREKAENYLKMCIELCDKMGIEGLKNKGNELLRKIKEMHFP